MNRQDLNELQADLAELISRLRDLEVSVPMSKAAALHSLAEAVYHLQRVRTLSDSIPSVPPPDANHAARNNATQKFRNASEICRSILKDPKK